MNRITQYRWLVDEERWVPNGTLNLDPFDNPERPRDPDFMGDTMDDMLHVGVHPWARELWFMLANLDVDGPQRWANLAEDMIDGAQDKPRRAA